MKSTALFAILAFASYGCTDPARIVETGALGVAPQRALVAAATITDLGMLTGGTYGRAQGINSAGQVVGYADKTGAGYRAFLWENGVMADLGGYGDFGRSTASDINDAGQIVGGVDIGAGVGAPVIWENGVFTRLPTEGDACCMGAVAINDPGQVAGTIRERAVVWQNGAITTTLPTLGGSYTQPLDINDAGVVVGYSKTIGEGEHAFLYDPATGTMTDLGTLAPTNPGAKSAAFAINGLGQVVGQSDAAGGSHAFLWENGVMTDLGSLGTEIGRMSSAAHDINDAGQVAGETDVAGGRAGFLWSGATGMMELPSVPEAVPCCSGALALNGDGKVAGYSGARAVLWTVTGGGIPSVAPLQSQLEQLQGNGLLNGGQTNALLAHLGVADRALHADRPGNAINAMRAFIRQVEAFVKAGILTTGDAEPLIGGAESLIRQLGS